MILFAGNARSKFMAVELLDGRLYYVHNFGSGERRIPFSSLIVADGQTHEVSIN